MLRVVYLGMDLRILDALRVCPVNLCGAYLPPLTNFFRYQPSWYYRLVPRIFIKRKFQTAAAFAGIAQVLADSQITALSATSVNDQKFIKRIAGDSIDLCVVANFNQKLGRRLISTPKYGCINYHPSLLPKYRGPHPFGHILLNKEKTSGATWHIVAEGMDSGDILAQREFNIKEQDSESDLDRKAVTLAIDMLGPLLDDIGSNQVCARPQDEFQATYFPKLTKWQKQQLKQQGKR